MPQPQGSSKNHREMQVKPKEKCRELQVLVRATSRKPQSVSPQSSGHLSDQVLWGSPSSENCQRSWGGNNGALLVEVPPILQRGARRRSPLVVPLCWALREVLCPGVRPSPGGHERRWVLLGGLQSSRRGGGEKTFVTWGRRLQAPLPRILLLRFLTGRVS